MYTVTAILLHRDSKHVLPVFKSSILRPVLVLVWSSGWHIELIRDFFDLMSFYLLTYLLSTSRYCIGTST